MCGYCGKQLMRYPTKTDHYFCDIKCKSEFQRLQKPVDRDTLYDLYVLQKKSANQIAKIYHRDAKTVWNWLKDYQIPTRPRGTNYGQWFRPGHISALKGTHLSEKQKEFLRQCRLQDGHVPYLINGVHWLKATGRKPASWKGGVTPLRQRIYSSSLWKICTEYVWKRDNAECQRCGKKFNETDRSAPFHIHHIYSFANYPYLRTAPDNLVLLCPECHRFIHSKENTKQEYLTRIQMSLPEWPEFSERRNNESNKSNG